MPTDPKQTEAYLRTLNTSDRARAAAFDAVHNADDKAAEALLRQLPFSDAVKAELWDLRAGGTVSGGSEPKPAATEEFMDPEAAGPEGSAAGRFFSNAGAMLNPITAVRGIAGAVAHPIDAATNIYNAQAEQFGKAAEDYRQGRYWEMGGHAAAGALPLVGPAAAEAGEQIAAGDVAGGLGKGTGLLATVVGPSAARGAVKGARKLLSGERRQAIASGLEESAAGRVADVMSPKVGANKTRFGNQAEKVAPAIAKDLATKGAPWSRSGLHDFVKGKLAEGEQGLDAASDARLASQQVRTGDILNVIDDEIAKLTATPVEASRPVRAATGPAVRGARVPEEFGTSGDVRVADVPVGRRGFRTMDTGEFADPQLREVPMGRAVEPAPSAPQIETLRKIRSEVAALGPTAPYESIRRIRAAWDQVAKLKYMPSETQDALRKMGTETGAMKGTGAIREALAATDPNTATANTTYSIYRGADDVLEATREIERARPRVGRLIANRIFGTVAGSQAAGPAGAVAGYVAAPFLDAGAAMGVTTKLKVAALQQRLATAIRQGNVSQVNFLTNNLREIALRELKTTGPVQVGRLTNPSESQRNTGPVTALP